MHEASGTIRNFMGAHARPCHEIVKITLRFDCEVRMSCGPRSVNAKSILELMSLSMPVGSVVTIVADGEGEEEVVRQVVAALDAGFGEHE